MINELKKNKEVIESFGGNQYISITPKNYADISSVITSTKIIKSENFKDFTADQVSRIQSLFLIFYKS